MRQWPRWASPQTRPRPGAHPAILPDIVLSYHLAFQSVAFGDLVMLDEEFRKQRARTVRDLAEKANDRFIKRRLLDLAARYEDEGPRPRTTLTPIDLQFASRGTGPER